MNPTRALSRLVLTVSLGCSLSAASSCVLAGDQLDFEGLNRVIGSIGTEREHTLRPQPTPASAAAPGQADSRNEARPSSDRAVAPIDPGAFSVAKDTPAFRPFKHASSDQNGTMVGTQFGLCLMTMQWYQTFAVPVFKPVGWLDKVLGNRVAIKDKLGVEGPVTRRNIEEYRLRAYSAPAERQPGLQRMATKFDDDRGYLFNRGKKLLSKDLFERMRKDLANDNAKLAVVGLKTSDATSGLSVLVYKAEESTQRVDGKEVDVWKFYFYDANSTTACKLPPALCYLVYVPSREMWSLSSAWAVNAEQTGEQYLYGGRLGTFQLEYHGANSPAARTWRNFWNYFQSDPGDETAFRAHGAPAARKS
ncbi:MAG: hypothetical protein HY814_15165 [Candidatus Riflebacteria bacterium]|nr:hypothetical protein [Candidatus Riflebacteria bacterium]